MIQNEYIYILRVLISGLCGMAIGYERKNRSKEAGVRTHCIVACAAALMMIISKYGFSDLINNPMGTKGVDPARIAAQIVSGIGFLGAGMIFVHKENITGLTTAAGIWTTAGIGMAIGSGMYLIGIVVTVIVITVQTFMHHINKGNTGSNRSRILIVYNVDERDYQQNITSLMNSLGITVCSTSIKKNTNDTKTYEFLIEMPETIIEEQVISQIEHTAEIRAES